MIASSGVARRDVGPSITPERYPIKRGDFAEVSEADIAFFKSVIPEVDVLTADDAEGGGLEAHNAPPPCPPWGRGSHVLLRRADRMASRGPMASGAETMGWIDAMASAQHMACDRMDCAGLAACALRIACAEPTDAMGCAIPLVDADPMAYAMDCADAVDGAGPMACVDVPDCADPMAGADTMACADVMGCAGTDQMHCADAMACHGRMPMACSDAMDCDDTMACADAMSRADPTYPMARADGADCMPRGDPRRLHVCGSQPLVSILVSRIAMALCYCRWVPPEGCCGTRLLSVWNGPLLCALYELSLYERP